MTWERIYELVHKNNRSEAEDNELEILKADRFEQQCNMIVRPTCCKAAQKYPIISFVAHPHDDGSLSGSWEAHIDSHFSSLFRSSKYKYKDKPSVKFCPYCSTKLPKMVLKKEIPPHVCKITDGGYYCDTCKERLDSCFCDLQETLFEEANE